MPNETEITILDKTYLNHTITLEPTWEFTVNGPEFDKTKYQIRFPSYKAARDEIQNRVVESQKLAAKSVVLNLIALDSDGEQLIINKINRSTGVVADGEIYPCLNWIRDALKRRKIIITELRNIEKRLRPFSIGSRHGYGRINIEDYVRYIERLKTEFVEKSKAAAEAVTEAEPTSASAPN